MKEGGLCAARSAMTALRLFARGQELITHFEREIGPLLER
jgi:hypothetical protein